MKKKLEERILAEIRNRVIDIDRERKNEQEIKDMREANIEALTELTSLSRKEVEKIADEVKKEQLLKAKQQRKRITGLITILAVAILIAYFIFKPKPEPKVTLVVDDFSNNKYEWTVLNSFSYKRYFKDNQYVFETNKDEWCYWDNVDIQLPTNYDVEISANWINGKFDNYGIGLLENNTNYYSFTISGDGSSSYGKVVNKEWVIDDADKQDMALKGKNQKNILKVEVRGKIFNYLVNKKPAASGTMDLGINSIALRCCGEQQVAFDYLRVINADTKKTVYEEKFSNPDKRWEPKKSILSESYFENGQYIINVDNDDNCYWSKSRMLEITPDCEIELSSKWLSGELANYGLMIIEDDDNYYSCELQNNGEARLVECKYDKYTYVQEFINTGFESDGKTNITQKAVIKNGILSYYINDKLIKENPFSLYHPAYIGLRMCGKQSVAFDDLKLRYFE